MTVFDKHQLKIAKQTLKYTDAAIEILAGMTKEEAITIIKKFETKNTNGNKYDH